MPGEVFGEADIILKVRLDELQDQLDQSERMVVQQANRMQAVQQQTANSVRYAAQEAEKGVGVIGQVGQAIGAWKLLSLAVRGGGVALAAIPALALAAKVALVGLKTGGVLLVVGAIGMMEEATVRFKRSIGESVEAAKNLDGSTGRVLELAQALEKIPIFGRSASTAFRIFSGDVEVADKALTDLVATVEDGQVKIGFFSRYLGRGLGMGDFINDIDEANRKMREFNTLNAERAARQERGGRTGEALGSITQSAGDAARLAGLEGVELVRAEREIAHRDAISQIDRQQKAHQRAAAERLRAIQDARDAEEINAGVARKMQRIITKELQQLDADAAAARKQVEKDVNAVYRERLQQAEKLAAVEDRRLAAVSKSATLAAGGDSLGAQLVMIEHRKQEAITAALESGQNQRIEMIERYYDAQKRIALDSANEQAKAEHDAQMRRVVQMQEALDRERQIEQERRQHIAERTEDVQSDVRAQTLRNQGDEFGARREEIINSFKSQIEEAIKSGDSAFLGALQDLRELRLAALDAEERDAAMRDAERANREADRAVRMGSDAQARQIDSALAYIGGAGGDPKREEKDMVKEQKETNKLLKKGQVAVAG